MICRELGIIGQLTQDGGSGGGSSSSTGGSGRLLFPFGEKWKKCHPLGYYIGICERGGG